MTQLASPKPTAPTVPLVSEAGTTDDDQHVPNPRVDLKASFARLTYPFLFPAHTFDARSAATTSAKWPGPNGDLKVWSPSRFPTDSVLAHVAKYLALPPKGADAAPDPPPTARGWKLTESALKKITGAGPEYRWDLTSSRLRPRHITIPFTFKGVELVLFRTGVGLLTLRLHPTTPDLDAWLDFLHTIRFFIGDRHAQIRAWLPTDTAKAEPFFPHPTQAPEQLGSDGWGRLSWFNTPLLRTADLATDQPPPNHWWKEVFVPGQGLPFAGVYVDGHPADADAQLLHRLRFFFHPGQGDIPCDDDLRLDGHSALLPYARRQWFVFSLDGGSFLACDAPGPNERSFAFNRSTLPGHLQGIYFLVLLLTLHQRFALIMLSEQVAQYWREHGHATGSRAREEAYTDFERLRDAFLTFTARGYFAQVMQHEHHHRCYRRWQEAFQIERLYQEVSDEIREMHGHLLLERERDAQLQVRRLEQRLNAFALLLGVPALLLTLVTAVGTVPLAIGVAMAIGGAIAGWIILVALNGSLARHGRRLWRRSRPPGRKR